MDDKSKLRIRDYYFSYLHQEETDKNNNSFFVSTSKSIEVAEDECFTGERDNKIVIYYFIPEPHIDRAIYSIDEPYLKKYCQENNLPTYYAPYDEEDEVCIKVALSPHNILGVTTYIDDKEAFIVNHYLFEIDLKNFVSNGLDIDSKKFDKIIETTEYLPVENDGSSYKELFPTH